MRLPYTDFAQKPPATTGGRPIPRAGDAAALQEQLRAFRAGLAMEVTPVPLEDVVENLSGPHDPAKRWALQDGTIHHTQRAFHRVGAAIVQTRAAHQASPVVYPHVGLAEVGGYTYLAYHRPTHEVLVELRPEPGNPASKNFTLFGATAQTSRGRRDAERGMATLLGVLVGLPKQSQSAAVADGARFRGVDAEGRVDTICVVEVDDRAALERCVPDNLALVWTTPNALLRDPNFNDCGVYLKLALQQLSRWELGQA